MSIPMPAPWDEERSEPNPASGTFRYRRCRHLLDLASGHARPLSKSHQEPTQPGRVASFAQRRRLLGSSDNHS